VVDKALEQVQSYEVEGWEKEEDTKGEPEEKEEQAQEGEEEEEEEQPDPTEKVVRIKEETSEVFDEAERKIKRELEAVDEELCARKGARPKARAKACLWQKKEKEL